MDQSRAAADGDVIEQGPELERLLVGRSEDELEWIAATFFEYHAAACDWSLWASGYVIADGMSNDSFADFRSWLISRGRDVYDRALQDPDSLADLPEARAGDVDGESITTALYNAYLRTHGRDLPDVGPGDPPRPSGSNWREDDLETIVPRLWEL